MFLDPLTKIKTISSRHISIGNNEIGNMPFGNNNGVRNIGCSQDMIVGVDFQDIGQDDQ